MEAVAEALLFASKAGADPAKVRQALMGGFAGSKILEVHGERNEWSSVHLIQDSELSCIKRI
nr:NAD-binding protein [Polynucleobacter necessarius]